MYSQITFTNVMVNLPLSHNDTAKADAAFGQQLSSKAIASDLHDKN